MDKQKQSISIKINGKERTYDEDQSPDPKDSKHKLLYSHNGHEVAAAKESEEEGFTDIQEEKPPVSKVVPIEDLRNRTKKPSIVRKATHSKQKRKFSFSFSQPILTILLAVIIGTSFGMVILNLITHDEPTSGKAAIATLEEKTAPNEEPKAVSAKTVSVKLDPVNLTIVQAGVFQSEENRKALVAKIKGDGLAAAAIGAAVVTGIGMNESEAAHLLAAYTQSGQEAIDKPLTIKGASYDKISSKDAELLAEGQKLMGLLGSLSAGAFGQAGITGEQWLKIQQSHQKITALNSGELDKSLKPFSAHLQESYIALEKYQSDKDVKLLWKSQQELLDALAVYYDYVNGKQG